MWAMSWKNLFMPYANHKGADQRFAQSDQRLTCLLPRYRKTGNFRVVQFSRNFAVSINQRKLKSAKYFPVLEKLVSRNWWHIWLQFAVVTYSPAVRPVICNYLKNNLSLQAIWLEVNWSMTVPIYSVSRWLIFFCCCIWHTCNCFSFFIE